MSSHPRVYPRGTSPENAVASGPSLRVIVHAANDQRTEWVENELIQANAVIQYGRNVENIVAALTEDPPPRPQVLVVDFDAISAADLFQLHAIRELGWCGRIVGLGVVPNPLRASLGIERVLNTPLQTHTLRDVLSELEHGFDAMTTRIPVVLDDPVKAFVVRRQHVQVAVARARTR
jgi:hypothetical protein